jgi:hypothetical protein
MPAPEISSISRHFQIGPRGDLALGRQWGDRPKTWDRHFNPSGDRIATGLALNWPFSTPKLQLGPAAHLAFVMAMKQPFCLFQIRHVPLLPPLHRDCSCACHPRPSKLEQTRTKGSGIG